MSGPMLDLIGLMETATAAGAKILQRPDDCGVAVADMMASIAHSACEVARHFGYRVHVDTNRQGWTQSSWHKISDNAEPPVSPLAAGSQVKGERRGDHNEASS